MSRNTFEAWATPVDAPVLSSVADHTFVISGDTHFGCWGSSDTTNPQAAKVATGSGNKALCKATKYRGPMDSACLGIYAVNGVCHQSANLFLYAVDSTVLPLNKERPRGVIASHALYAVYGTDAPGMLPTSVTHFARWVSAVYGQAYARCLFASESMEKCTLSKDLVFEGYQEGSLEHRILANHYRGETEKNEGDSNQIALKDMQIMIDHILKTKEHPNEKTHGEILQDKNSLLTHYGLTYEEIQKGEVSLKESDIKALVKSLNQLAVDFQDDLKSKIGVQAFRQLNGDEKLYHPINPEIAVKTLNDLSELK